jgi:hypothetical protein
MFFSSSTLPHSSGSLESRVIEEGLEPIRNRRRSNWITETKRRSPSAAVSRMESCLRGRRTRMRKAHDLRISDFQIDDPDIDDLEIDDPEPDDLEINDFQSKERRKDLRRAAASASQPGRFASVSVARWILADSIQANSVKRTARWFCTTSNSLQAINSPLTCRGTSCPTVQRLAMMRPDCK